MRSAVDARKEVHPNMQDLLCWKFYGNCQGSAVLWEQEARYTYICAGIKKASAAFASLRCNKPEYLKYEICAAVRQWNLRCISGEHSMNAEFYKIIKVVYTTIYGIMPNGLDFFLGVHRTHAWMSEWTNPPINDMIVLLFPECRFPERRFPEWPVFQKVISPNDPFPRKYYILHSCSKWSLATKCSCSGN